MKFDTPQPLMAHNEPNHRRVLVKLQNMYSQFIDQVSSVGHPDNGALSFDILKEGTSSATLGSNSMRGRDLVTIIPKILNFLDRMEPDKGRQARYLIEQLIGHHTLPSNEEEL